MQGTGKKHAPNHSETAHDEGEVVSLMQPRMQSAINELQGLSERWRQMKAGDPERFRVYHGYEARGI
ncbi:hypothetical protein KO537_22435 [Shewanella sp. NKUCC01_JLK]|uniref:hypothetical protein n=1 Tax=Shewanella sp. NKUCC01_JLK TaxID=2842123 RepID=UPI001C5BE46F|nr:hypothetical protein [Shewanella sp. NKUCC01_JLK]MBW3517449.1 hypothetical protein [Shewanella sp. NKUCC01_JLK]